MYKWYYGTGCYPEKHDRKNALAEMIIGFAGFGACCLVAAVALVMWAEGLV